MKKKTIKKVNKYASIESKLDEIITRLGQIVVQTAKSPIESISQKISSNELVVTFPKLTAKEIIDSCNNAIDTGKLTYSGLNGWYKNESFFTQETCREGRRIISLELLHGGKSWNEINAMGKEMLNLAEVLYLIKEFPQYRELLKYQNTPCYIWTSSRDSDGKLVDVGGFDEEGVSVHSDTPDYRYDSIGVSFSRVL